MDTLQFGHSVIKLEDVEDELTTTGRLVDLRIVGFEAEAVGVVVDRGMLILAEVVVVILGSFADMVGFLLKNISLL